MALTKEQQERSIKELQALYISQNACWMSYDETKLEESYRITNAFRFLVNCQQKTILLATGNQFGKNEAIATDWAWRIMGRHPIKWKNVHPTDRIRTFRVCAETLPSDKLDAEKRNTVYPALMRRIPRNLIKKDITARSPVQTIRDPQGGPDIYIEYVSYGQTTQSQAGVQRKAIWIDEGPSYEFYEEQRMRIIAAENQGGADIIMTYTPTETQSGWIFEYLYDRAKVIYRSKTVRLFLYEQSGNKELLPNVQYTDNDSDIAVIMASQYDNPTFSKETVDKAREDCGDPETVAARIFGQFKQLGGKVLKMFNPFVHVVNIDNLFETGIPQTYKFFRGIDYHPKTPWGCVFLALSPQDELFVWEEYSPEPEKLSTYQIAEGIASRSRSYKYVVDKIDPLAGVTQGNTLTSTLFDLNRHFMLFKQQGICTGGYWTPWDTKATLGIEEFRKRLYNAVRVGKPFCNQVVQDGRKINLPTIWFGNNCRATIESIKKWKYVENINRDYLITHDPKGDKQSERQQKFSHLPIAIECLLKCPELTHARFRSEFDRPREIERKQYFQGRR